MLTLRQATAEGLRAVKTREWNSDSLLREWRSAWAEHQNRALERAGRRERVDHRTLGEQRAEAEERRDYTRVVELDRTPEIHVGPQGRQARRRGFEPRSQVRGQQTARPRGGRWTSGTAEKRRREIDYPRIDQGQRSTYLERVLDGRMKRAQKLLLRRERQAVRFRDRFATFEKRQRAPVSIGRSLRPLSPAHLQRRAGQAQGLAQLVEQLMRGLFRTLERDRGRVRSLVNSRDIARSLGRGRERDHWNR